MDPARYARIAELVAEAELFRQGCEHWKRDLLSGDWKCAVCHNWNFAKNSMCQFVSGKCTGTVHSGTALTAEEAAAHSKAAEALFAQAAARDGEGFAQDRPDRHHRVQRRVRILEHDLHLRWCARAASRGEVLTDKGDDSAVFALQPRDTGPIRCAPQFRDRNRRFLGKSQSITPHTKGRNGRHTCADAGLAPERRPRTASVRWRQRSCSPGILS